MVAQPVINGTNVKEHQVQPFSHHTIRSGDPEVIEYLLTVTQPFSCANTFVLSFFFCQHFLVPRSSESSSLDFSNYPAAFTISYPFFNTEVLSTYSKLHIIKLYNLIHVDIYVLTKPSLQSR